MRGMAIGLLLAALVLAAAPPAHAQQDDQAICEGWAAEQAMPLLQQSLAVTPSGAPPYGPAGFNGLVGPFGAGPWGVAALGGPPGLIANAGPLGPGPTAFSLAPGVLAPSPAGTGGPNPAALATLIGNGQGQAGVQALFALLAAAGQGPNGGPVQALIAQLLAGQAPNGAAVLPLLQQLAAAGQGPNGPAVQALLAQLAMGASDQGAGALQLILAQLAASGQGPNGAAVQALLAQLAAGQPPSGAALQALQAQLAMGLNNQSISLSLPGVLTSNVGRLAGRPLLAPNGAGLSAPPTGISDQINLASLQQAELGNLLNRYVATNYYQQAAGGWLAGYAAQAKETYNQALADCNDYMQAARAAQAAGAPPPEQR
ncbi:MAG TPA: hypothetical protein VII06_24005 [Chloroflexota bacterium]